MSVLLWNPGKSYVEVLGVNVSVLGKVEVLLGDENTLTEEVLMNELTVGLGHKPARRSAPDLQISNPRQPSSKFPSRSVQAFRDDSETAARFVLWIFRRT